MLHYLVGPDRAEIEDAWQHVPGEDAVTRPMLVRWRSPVVPWGRRYVPEGDRWRRFAHVPEAVPVASMSGAESPSAEPQGAGIA